MLHTAQLLLALLALSQASALPRRPKFGRAEWSWDSDNSAQSSGNEAAASPSISASLETSAPAQSDEATTEDVPWWQTWNAAPASSTATEDPAVTAHSSTSTSTEDVPWWQTWDAAASSTSESAATSPSAETSTDVGTVKTIPLKRSLGMAKRAGFDGWDTTAYGCYGDSTNNRALRGTSKTGWAGMTIENCLDFCLAANYRGAGVENGNACYCDNQITYSTSSAQTWGKPTAAGNCNVPCSGNKSQLCGGNDGSAVYIYVYRPDAAASSTSSSLAAYSSSSSLVAYSQSAAAAFSASSSAGAYSASSSLAAYSQSVTAAAAASKSASLAAYSASTSNAAYSSAAAAYSQSAATYSASTSAAAYSQSAAAYSQSSSAAAQSAANYSASTSLAAYSANAAAYSQSSSAASQSAAAYSASTSLAAYSANAAAYSQSSSAAAQSAATYSASTSLAAYSAKAAAFSQSSSAASQSAAAYSASTSLAAYSANAAAYSQSSSAAAQSAAAYSASTSLAAYSANAAAYSQSTAAAAQSAAAYSASTSLAAYSAKAAAASESAAAYSQSTAAAAYSQSAASYSQSAAAYSAAQSAAAYSEAAAAFSASQSQSAYSQAAAAYSTSTSLAAYSQSISNAAASSAAAYSASASLAAYSQDLNNAAASASAYSASASAAAYSASSASAAAAAQATPGSTPPVLASGWSVAPNSCIAEGQTGRALVDSGYSAGDMTPQQCTQHCADGGFTIAGVEYGAECFCGTILSNGASLDKTSSACTMTCSGDKTALCGGPNALQLFIDTAKAHGTLNAQMTSLVQTLPSGWAAASTSCIAEGTTGRALSGASTSANDMTVAKCLNYCQNSGFLYAGVEYGSECYCGNSLTGGASLSLPSSTCSMHCSGDPGTICGGPNGLQLYTNPANAKTASLPSGWSAASTACIAEGSTGRALSGATTAADNMTPQVCLAFCQTKGFQYAGIEYGRECYCGNTIDNGASLNTASTSCNMACAGDNSQTCGGPGALTLFSNPANAPSNSAINGFASKGCVQEVDGRALRGASTASDDMTIEKCTSFCGSKGFSMAGVEYGAECYCDNSFQGGASLDLVSGQCYMTCPGNSKELCGGPNAIQLYSTK